MMLLKATLTSPCTPQSVPDLFGTICQAASAPLVCEVKEAVPLWGFFRLSPFAQSIGIDDQGRALFRAVSSTFNAATALVVDYDGGASFDLVRNLVALNGWQAVMHTTHSHFKDGKERFRVIMPLADVIPMATMHDRNWVLTMLELFPDCDPSTFSPARFFYLPAIHPARKDEYRFDAIEGRLFGTVDYQSRYRLNEEIARLDALRKPKRRFKTLGSIDEAKVRAREEARRRGIEEFVQEHLGSLKPWNNGNDNHSELLQINGWLYSIGLDVEERLRIVMPFIDVDQAREVERIVTGLR